MLMTFSPLDDIRDNLRKVDLKLAGMLGKFRAAADPDKIHISAERIAAVKFPDEIEALAINRNVPRELFTGVKLFLALNTTETDIKASRHCDHAMDKLEEFKELCNLLCDRHDLSRQVFEHKKENAEHFRSIDGKVETFIPDQHEKVVARMRHFSLEQGFDYDLSARIIDWVAAVNAGWQDMAINENRGPFVEPVKANAPVEIRDPRPTLQAA